MNNYPNSLSGELKKLPRDNIKNYVKTTSNVLDSFSGNIKEKINSSDFTKYKEGDNAEKIIDRIFQKVDLSSRILKDAVADLLGPEQQFEISFLYLWSTLNDIYHLRIKIESKVWSIFLRNKEQIDIDLANIEKGNNNNEIRKNDLIRKFNEAITNGGYRKGKEFAEYRLNDFIWLILLCGNDTKLDDFKKCKGKRNQLLVIHQDLFKKNRYQPVNHKDIIIMKELVELLLFLK